MTSPSDERTMPASTLRPGLPSLGGDRAMLLLLALFALAPLVLEAYLVGELTRVMIYGMAACAVGFAIRHGGLVSFGHAAFFGMGAYCVLMARNAGYQDALLVWPLALLAVALLALVIGLLSLRTGGVAFIMITLGFAQMVYFVVSGSQSLGAADGLPLFGRDMLAGISLDATEAFHYLVLVALGLVLLVMTRLSRSPAGLALRGIAHDERRMKALGYAPKRLQLTSFVFSAVVAGFAGVLAANFYQFVGPAYLHWLVSGELLVMVALGGIASLSGGLFGALILVLFEAVFSEYTTYWRIFLGPAVILSVLYLHKGVHPALERLLGGRDD